MKVIGVISHKKYKDLVRNGYATDFKDILVGDGNDDSDFSIFRNISNIRVGVPHLPFVGISRLFGEEVSLSKFASSIREIFSLDKDKIVLDILVEVEIEKVECNILSLDTYLSSYRKLRETTSGVRKETIKQAILECMRLDTASPPSRLRESTYIAFLPELELSKITNFVILHHGLDMRTINAIAEPFSCSGSSIEITNYFGD